jgi:TonB-linked SusC/RagA family outer membrane protein
MTRQFTRLLAAAALALVPAAVVAQEGTTISGQVRGEAGQPLAGASVFLEGLNLGTLSREDGQYTLTIPGARSQGQRATLTARLIGYRPQSAQVTLTAGSVTQDFTLPSNPLQLGELVITGAGTAIEAEKLGSVRNAVSAEQITKAAEPNIVQALAAKAPNVNITQSSGEPGSSSYIRIRGLRTVNSSSQPLFVIDGVPVDNQSLSTSNFNPTDELGSGELSGTTQMNRAMDINPNDIENIEILKGPAAGAIYGARAAQGVILITTKKGRPGQTRYSLRSQWSFDDLNNEYPLQRNFGQGLTGLAPDASATNPSSFACNDPNNTTRCLRSWGPELTPEAYQQSLLRPDDPATAANELCDAACALAAYNARFPNGLQIYDHGSEAYDTGITADNTLTVSGGNERTTFYFSASYFDQAGIFVGPNNEFQRATVRLNASHRMLENLNILANVQYADTRGNFIQRGNNANGLQLGLLRTPPEVNNLPYLDPVSGLHRSYRMQVAPAGTETQSRGFDNPFFILNEPVSRSYVGRIFGNIGSEYQANNWLKFNYTLGADYSSDERLEGAPQASSDVSAGGRVTEGTINIFQLDHNLTGTATYQVSPNFSGTLTLGQNLNMRNTRQISAVGRQLVAPQPFKLVNTVQRDLPLDTETNIRLESYFGQATFDLLDQLYITAALRNDGSSTFSEGNERSWYPKASVAWNATRYLGEQRFVSFAKLRAAYGEAGQEPQAYLTNTVYDGTTIIGGIVQGTGFTATQQGFGGLYSATLKAADDLKAERTKELELGFDLGLFNDVADFGFTYYNARTEDVILNTPIPPSTGYLLQAQNSATFRNQGIELTFNVRPLRRPDMTWNLGANWANNKSKVVELRNAEVIYVDATAAGVPVFTPGNAIIEGEEIGVFHGTGVVRCGISPGGLGATIPNVDLDVACAGAPTGALYLAANGFPVGDPTQRVLGDPNPDWTAGFNSQFTWRKWTFSGLLDFRKGGDIWNGTASALYSYGTHKDTESRCTLTRNPATNAVTGCVGNDRRFGSSDWYPGPVAGPGVDASTGTGIVVPIGENWYRGAVTGVPGNGLAPCAFSGIDELCIEDGGFVKLRELSVAYTLDTEWVRRTLGFSNVDLRVAGRNLATWSDYSGYDPETSLGGSIQNTRGQDYFNQPQTRSFVFSVTLNR